MLPNTLGQEAHFTYHNDIFDRVEPEYPLVLMLSRGKSTAQIAGFDELVYLEPGEGWLFASKLMHRSGETLAGTVKLTFFFSIRPPQDLEDAAADDDDVGDEQTLAERAEELRAGWTGEDEEEEGEDEQEDEDEESGEAGADSEGELAVAPPKKKKKADKESSEESSEEEQEQEEEDEEEEGESDAEAVAA